MQVQLLDYNQLPNREYHIRQITLRQSAVHFDPCYELSVDSIFIYSDPLNCGGIDAVGGNHKVMPLSVSSSFHRSKPRAVLLNYLDMYG